MTDPKNLSVNDLDRLATLRDELRLQAHLFKAELKDRWQEAEDKWNHLQTEAHALARAVGHSSQELGAATKLMADALHQTYEDIRKSLRTH